MNTARGLLVIAIASVAGCAAAPPPTPELTAPVTKPAPPPSRVEAVPPTPSPNMFWMRGYWRWEGDKYAWVEGRWEPKRVGWHWVPAHWELPGEQWAFVGGEWQPD